MFQNRFFQELNFNKNGMNNLILIINRNSENQNQCD